MVVLIVVDSLDRSREIVLAIVGAEVGNRDLIKFMKFPECQIKDFGFYL